MPLPKLMLFRILNPMLSPLIASPLLAIIWLFGGWVRYFNAPQPVYFSSLVLKPPHRSLGVSKASSRAIWPLCCVCKDKCHKPKGQFRLLTPHLFIPRQLVPHYLCCTICFFGANFESCDIFSGKMRFSHVFHTPEPAFQHLRRCALQHDSTKRPRIEIARQYAGHKTPLLSASKRIFIHLSP